MLPTDFLDLTAWRSSAGESLPQDELIELAPECCLCSGEKLRITAMFTANYFYVVGFIKLLQ